MASRPSSPPRIPPVGALLVAVVAISWAGPLVRLASAPAIVVAMWRLVFTMGIMAVILGGRGSFLGGAVLDGRDRLLALAAGALLAAHFWTWFASIDATTIAHAVVLISTYPFWIAALSVWFLGERPAGRTWVGIGIAVAGTGVIAGSDLSLSGGSLAGDLLALGSAVLVAGYYTIGRDLRQRLDVWSYTGLVYGVAAVFLAVAAILAEGGGVIAQPPRDWLIYLLLAAGPMMLGHTGINYAIRYMPAYVANLAILAEAVGAIVIAWLLPEIGEVPTATTVVGAVLVLAGIGLGATKTGGRRGRGDRETESGLRAPGRAAGGTSGGDP